MNEIDVTASRRAYILARQLEAMHRAIEASPDDVSGYTAHATSYNEFLGRAMDIFQSDLIFEESSRHLERVPEELSDDVLEHFGRLRANSVVLKAAVFAFFEFYSPQEEKRRIGFESSESPQA